MQRDLEQHIKELKNSNLLQKERLAGLELESQTLKQQADMSNEAREKMIEDQKNIMEKQHTDLKHRMEIENEKLSLQVQLTQQKHEAEMLQKTLDTIRQDLERSNLSQEEKDKEYDTTKSELEAKYVKAVEEHRERISTMEETMDSKDKAQCVELQRLQDTIRGFEHETTTNRLEQQKLEADKSIIQQQLDQNKELLADFKQRLEQKNSELSNALAGFSQVQEFAKDANQKLHDEKAQLEQKVREYEPKLAELKTFKATWVLETQQLQQQISVRNPALSF